MVDVNFTIVVQLINFLILVFILKKIFWEPLMRHIDRRDALISDRKDETEELKAKTLQMRREYNERLRAARGEGIQLRDRLITEGRVERTRLMDEALDKAERAISAGEERLLTDKQATLESFRDEDIDLLADLVVKRVLSVEKR